MRVLHTPDEIINIIAETLAEGDAEYIAEIAEKVLIGHFEADNDANTITWEWEE